MIPLSSKKASEPHLSVSANPSSMFKPKRKEEMVVAFIDEGPGREPTIIECWSEHLNSSSLHDSEPAHGLVKESDVD